MEMSFTTRNATLDLCLIYKKIPQEGTYTSRVIMKTNAAKLEIHACNSRYRNSQSFVSNEPSHSNCMPLPLGATNLESGYPTTKQSITVYSVSSKDKVSKRCASTLAHDSRWATQSKPIYAECKTVDQKGSISKTVLLCPLYLEILNYDKIVRFSLPTDSYQRFAGICHHWGRISWVSRPRNCTSCVPSSLLRVYHTQTRPQGPHSPGSEPAGQRGTPYTHTNTKTPPNVYPLLLSMTL